MSSSASIDTIIAMATDIEFIPDLFDHQKEAVDSMLRWEKESLFGVHGGLLAYEMGLGKTRIVLEMINQRKVNSRTIGPTLVICPLTAVSVWIRDLKKFYLDELTYIVLHSSYCDIPKTITQRELDEYDVVITTYDMVRMQFKESDVRSFIVRKGAFSEIEPRLFKRSEIDKTAIDTGVKWKIVGTSKTNEPDPSHYTPIYSRRWSRIVADESTRFANLSTSISRAMIALNGDSYFCLSGTPITNYDTDLYNMFVFMGLTLLKKDWKPQRYHAMNLPSRVLSKKYEDTNITLPKSTYTTVELALSDTEKRIYNIVVEKLKDEYSLYKKGEKSFAAPLAMFTRLRQICACAGVLAIEPESKIRKRRDLEAMKQILESSSSQDENLDAILEAEEEIGEDVVTKLFEDEEIEMYLRNTSNHITYTKIAKSIDIVMTAIAEGKKVLIFSCFVKVLTILKRLLEELGIGVLQLDGRVGTEKRKDMQDIFNSSNEYTVFLSSYKAGGMAIDLTSAEIVILIDPWWNVATEQQAIARAHRTGQTKEVQIYSLIAVPSFETYLLKVQNRKYLITKEFFTDHKEKYTKYKPGSSIAKSIIENIIYSTI